MKKKFVVFNEGFKIDSTQKNGEGNLPVREIEPIDTIIRLDELKKSELKVAMDDAQSEIRSVKDMLFGQITYKNAQKREIEQYITAWHKKFTLSVAVIVLFFIGAPLGAIIKKGGLGTPLVFATLFFLLYYILTIMGENMVDSGFITPWKGIWMSTVILTPLGIFLTYKAANDSSLFDWDAYRKLFKKIFSRS